MPSDKDYAEMAVEAEVTVKALYEEFLVELAGKKRRPKAQGAGLKEMPVEPPMPAPDAPLGVNNGY